MASLKVLTDLHTHTVASTHAYSTVKEMAEHAARVGMEMIAITDHAPAAPDSAHIWHFENLWRIPRKIEGVTILRGVEANILNEEGDVDLSSDRNGSVEIVIASAHNPVFVPISEQQCTNMWLGVIENPQVDILGHPAAFRSFLFDIDKVVKKAKEYNKLIEINSSYFNRKPSAANNVAIAKRCKELGVKIVVNSDAHICYEVGNMREAIKALQEIEFPEKLIANANEDRMLNYLIQKRGDVLEGIC